MTSETVELLNSKLGLRTLMAYKNMDYDKAIERIFYEKKLCSLQTELIKLQSWVIEQEKKSSLSSREEMLPEKEGPSAERPNA